jgi:hypothetical protein
MATFFDLYENGMFDVILVEKEDDRYRLGAFTNITQDSDAYFVKVIVLSGKSRTATGMDGTLTLIFRKSETSGDIMKSF